MSKRYGSPGFEEVLVHVYWSRASGLDGHRLIRDKVSADLGLDGPPVPAFTEAEMQEAARAAKLALLKAVARRRKVKPPQWIVSLPKGRVSHAASETSLEPGWATRAAVTLCGSSGYFREALGRDLPHCSACLARVTAKVTP